jgi:hypothetical protein
METRSSASQTAEDARFTQTMPGSGRQRAKPYFSMRAAWSPPQRPREVAMETRPSASQTPEFAGVTPSDACGKCRSRMAATSKPYSFARTSEPTPRGAERS